MPKLTEGMKKRAGGRLLEAMFDAERARHEAAITKQQAWIDEMRRNFRELHWYIRAELLQVFMDDCKADMEKQFSSRRAGPTPSARPRTRTRRPTRGGSERR